MNLFIGNDLTSWYQHFKLSDKAIKHLEGLGVNDVEDLKLCFGDEAIEMGFNDIGRVNVRKIRDAKELTALLEGNSVRTWMNGKIFRGNNYLEWTKHFKLSEAVEEFLAKEEVMNVEDLQLVYEDSSIMKDLENVEGLKQLDLKKFALAKALTLKLNPLLASAQFEAIEASSQPISTFASATVPQTTFQVEPLSPTVPKNVCGSVSQMVSQSVSQRSSPTVQVSKAARVDNQESQSGLINKSALVVDSRIGSPLASSSIVARAVEAAKPAVSGVSLLQAEMEKVQISRTGNEGALQDATTLKPAYKTSDYSPQRTNPVVSAEAVRREQYIRAVEVNMRRKSSVDIVFVMDCTSSMSSYLVALKTNVAQFVESIRRIHSAISIRIAFVGYRDYGDVDRHVVLPFTTSVKAFEDIVRAQRATGGGDEAEDVLGGLDLVGQLDWLSETRILYHVGDAPCHGKEYHAPEVSDRFLLEEQEPMGLKSLAVLRGLRSSHIQYFFAKINGSTDLMIKRFNEIAGPPYPYVYETLVTSGNMMDVIQAHVIEKVSTSVLKAGSVTTGAGEQRVVHVGLSDPQRTTSAIEKAMVYRMTMPSSMDEFMSESTNRCVSNFPAPDIMEVAIETKQFARGGLRAAFCGMWHNPPTQPDRPAPWPIVVKESLAKESKYKTKIEYEKFLVCHRAAAFLGQEFERVRPPGFPPIRFCDAHIMQLMERWPEQPFCIFEEQIAFRFEKYNSNTGYCAPNPTLLLRTNHDAVQAFSHWTYHFTESKLMVVDCQGGYDPNKGEFILTDPAIHCINTTQYGRTNLGTRGFDHFFQSHVCNGHCAALGLPLVSAMKKQGGGSSHRGR